MAGNTKNLRIAVTALGISVGMLGLAYASVPLYRIFCQVTGFGGTTQRADAAPQRATTTPISVRFDANTSSKLNWAFHAVQPTMTVKIGEQNMAYFRAKNISDEVLTGSAVFNVTPPTAGIYFNKIQCFCFTEQTLKPGESIDMPVVFFLDPAMVEDADLDEVSTITLSYTFFPVKQKKPDDKPVAGLAGTDNRKPL